MLLVQLLSKQLRMLVNQVTNLRICAELRLTDHHRLWHVYEGLAESNVFRGCDANEFTIFAKGCRVAACTSDHTVVGAPLVETYIFLLLLELAGLLPIDFQIVALTRPDLILDPLDHVLLIARFIQFEF